MTSTIDTGVVALPVSELVAHNYREASPEDVRNLARTIEADGLVKDAIDVVKLPDGGYQIVSGHHRVGAVKLLGWDTIPGRVLDLAPDSPECLLTAVAGNLTHHASKPTEDAEAFARLIDSGRTPEEIGLRIGQPASYVERRLTITKLDPVCRYIANKHGFAWCDPLVGMAWEDQRELVRALEMTPMNRNQWTELVGRAQARRAEMAQDAMFSGDFGLTSEEWSTDLAQYVVDAVAVDDTLEDMRRPIGKQEIAELLGYPVATVYQWSNRGLLPEPAGSLSSVPYWWDRDILEWAEATGRAGRRPAETREEA